MALACLAVAVVLLSSSDKYTVKAHFQSGGQLVKGNLVLSAGRKVGVVKSVELTDNGLAEVVMEVEDHVTPLREGTQATIRQSSQSSVAGRYVDLHLAPAGAAEIPDGGEIPEERTTTAVDIDQLFALFDQRTRKGLTNVIRGSAAQYEGRGEQTNAGWHYLNPSLVATTRLFAELHRDDEMLQRFVVASSKLVTDVAERRDDLAALVDGLATTTGAIARERTSLSQAIAQLPPFMRRANSTFVNLRSTLDEADPLVEESKPVARRLRPVLRQLRGFAADARPTVRDLADAVRRRGADNDLIELSHSTLPFRDVAIGPVRANGRNRRGAFAESAESLEHQAPHWAFQRPYAVDLTGWFDDFSHSGLYDANGSASRVATSVPAFRVVEGQIPQLSFIDYDQRAAAFRELGMVGQNNRCPGAAERNTRDNSNPWRPSSTYNCDPNHVPIGP
ncbi:MAG TPA: MlaD family protein [Solirubrobacteraceae bacterium]|nr:MlaD family protein [Solirubrobacteraceae bacterium]